MKIIDNYEQHEPGQTVNDTKIPDLLSEESKLYNENFEAIIKSIIQYGGFYIGRYETGSVSNVPKVVKMNLDIGNCTWKYYEGKCKMLSNGNANITSTMLYGCMFDATLEWLARTGAKTYKEIAVDSTSWGNYNNNSFSYISADMQVLTKPYGSSVIIPSGSCENLKANNIYDLSGNMYEWTLENWQYMNAVARGGRECNYGNNRYASWRSLEPDNNYVRIDYGCRAAIYINAD